MPSVSARTPLAANADAAIAPHKNDRLPVIPTSSTIRSDILFFSTIKQIQEFLDLADRRFFKDSVLDPLLEDGTLVMTNPDNPGDIHQKYVATRKVLTGDTIEE